MRYKARKILGRWLRFLMVAICLLTALFPIYWMFNTSLKGQFEIYQRIPTLFPQKATLTGYTKLLVETPFLNSLKNSFLVALFTATFSIFVAYPAAYATARIRFWGRKGIANAILFAYLIPTSVLYIPLFIFLSNIGLTNSLAGLMLIYPTFTLPYSAWMLIPHIRSVPRDIEEAAIVDGCSRLRLMYSIVAPLAMPGIISTYIFSFALCWGEYLYALVNISSSKMKTFPLVISGLIFGDIYPWNQLMAGAIIACVPILLVYLFFSNMLVGGTTEGGVKA
ncbi:MAG: carbohydrate ABC transporter permease [Candidatus Limiplasma sp.]|nr:carbohydrate ABC transporter permease [Candidatus Limiplasma sp.]